MSESSSVKSNLVEANWLHYSHAMLSPEGWMNVLRSTPGLLPVTTSTSPHPGLISGSPSS